MKIYGYHSVNEALKSNKTIEKVFIARNARGRIKELEKEIRRKKIHIQYVPEEVLVKLAKTKRHQGILAIISEIKYWDLEELVKKSLEETENPYFIFAIEVSNAGNIASIIRSSECLGAAGVIFSAQGTPVISPEIVRMSVGAAHRVPLVRTTDPKYAFTLLKGYNIKIFGTHLKAETFIHETDKKIPHCWVLGSEQKGLNPKYLKYMDLLVKIPQATDFNSLNVSNAAAICLYESMMNSKF